MAAELLVLRTTSRCCVAKSVGRGYRGRTGPYLPPWLKWNILDSCRRRCTASALRLVPS